MTALVAAAAGVPASRAVDVLIRGAPGGDADCAAWSRTHVPALITVGGFAALGLQFGPSPYFPPTVAWRQCRSPSASST